MPQFFISNSPFKKYDVITPSGRRISFGDLRYGQFQDRTPIKAFSHLDHFDNDRRRRYLLRALAIKDKKGEYTYNNPESPNFYSIRYLW